MIITNWDDKKIASFLDGVRTGKILPESSGHTQDSKGPLTYFCFKEFNCEIHVHWIDSEREKMSVAHLKDISSGEIITTIVDTYTISMLRHYSGLENNKIRTNKNNTIKYLIYIIIPILLLLGFVIVQKNKNQSNKTQFEPHYTTIRYGFSPNSRMEACLALHNTPDVITGLLYCKSPESHIKQLKIGQRVKVLKIENYAAYIELDDGQRGWIHYAYIGTRNEKK